MTRTECDRIAGNVADALIREFGDLMQVRHMDDPDDFRRDVATVISDVLYAEGEV